MERPELGVEAVRGRRIRTVRAESVLLGMAAVWGTTFTAVKVGLAYASPLVFLAFRFLFALGFLSLWVRPWRMRLDRSAWGAGLRLGFWLGLGFVLQTAGLLWTTASMSAFITGTSTAFTPLLEHLLGRGLPGPRAFLGVGMALAGLYCLSLSTWHMSEQALGGFVLIGLGLLWLARVHKLPMLGALLVGLGLWAVLRAEAVSFGIGEGLTLAAAFVWAVYIVELDHYSARAPAGALTWMQLAVVGAMALLLLPWFPIRLYPHPALWGGLLYLALVATVLTTWLQTRFQRQTSPTRAALIFATEPLFAALVAFLLLGERLGLHAWFGGVLIVGALMVSARPEA
ncbi:MAG: DMT family transporter [Bacteroidota bacterium]|nr:DMT family transporter [Rhodothermia bacterium]MDW8284828.1 DMT family transporter [Bacteroidota bacterium]